MGDFISWEILAAREYTCGIYQDKGSGQCPQMKQGRQEFGCGVLNGKIYVFGGSTGNKTVVRGSEVYDPYSKTWSPIRPFRVNNQFDHNVTAVREELYVYGGKYHDFDTRGGVKYDRGVKDAHGLKPFHHRVQNKCTFLSNNNLRREFEFAGKFVVAQGKILSMSISLSQIKVYDRTSKLWTELHSFSLVLMKASTQRSTQMGDSTTQSERSGELNWWIMSFWH